MHRRRLIATAAAALAAGPVPGMVRAVQAQPDCGYDLRRGPLCRADLSAALGPVIPAPSWQKATQWCWAAAAALLFRAAGHPVAAARLVAETFGRIEDVPFYAGAMVTRALARDWQDDSGTRFRVAVTPLYDFDSRLFAPVAGPAVAALAAGVPLLWVTRSHAMVLAGGRWTATAPPELLDLRLADPWPRRGMRAATALERAPIDRGGRLRSLCQMTFSVLPAPPSSPSPPAPRATVGRARTPGVCLGPRGC